MREPDPFDIILDENWRDTEFRVDHLREVISQARPGERYIRFLIPQVLTATYLRPDEPFEVSVPFATLAREKTRVFQSERTVWRFPDPQSLQLVRQYMADWRKYHGGS